MLLFLLLLHLSTCSTIVSCNISISGTFKSYIEDEYKRTNLMPRVSVQLILTLKLPGSADMTEKITHLLSLFRQPSWSACTAVLYGKQLRREQAELNINWQFSCLSGCLHTNSHTKLGETMSVF